MKIILIPTALLLLGIMAATPVDAQTVPAGCDAIASGNMALQTTTLTATIIKPITGLETATVTFLYTAENTGISVVTVPVTFSVKADKGWVTPVLSKTNAYVTITPGEATSASLPVQVQMSVAATAPAFDNAKITVTADPGPGACIPDGPPTNAEYQVKAGFFENWQAKFQTAIWKTGQNAKFQFQVEMDNLGNGQIKTFFARNEGTSKALSVAMPGAVITDTTISGGTTSKSIVPIDVQTPFKNGYENRRDNLIVDITGTSAVDTTLQLLPVQLSAVVQTQGVYVPGFEVATLLGAAVLGLAGVGRLRR